MIIMIWNGLMFRKALSSLMFKKICLLADLHTVSIAIFMMIIMIIVIIVPACYLLVTVMLLKFALCVCSVYTFAKCDLKKKTSHFRQTTQLIALFVLYSILTSFGPCECANPFEKN